MDSRKIHTWAIVIETCRKRDSHVVGFGNPTRVSEYQYWYQVPHGTQKNDKLYSIIALSRRPQEPRFLEIPEGCDRSEW